MENKTTHEDPCFCIGCTDADQWVRTEDARRADFFRTNGEPMSDWMIEQEMLDLQELDLREPCGDD